MKINFLVPTTGLTGGIKVIFIHATNLASWGHEVGIIYPYVLHKNASWSEVFAGKLKKIRRQALGFVGRDKIEWFKLDPRIKIIRVDDLSFKNVPPADIVIATANETADWLIDYPENRGEKFYFIQGYEIWTRDEASVNDTWRLPLKKIVVAEWLERLAREKFGQAVAGVVPNGVDLEIFYNPNKAFDEKPKILLMYHVLKEKGFTDGLKAFTIAKTRHPEISLTLFGAYKPTAEIKRNFPFYYRPSEESLRKLYSSHDIFLCPSHNEGFSLPPLEAMACQCAVMATDVGAIRECTVAGETAIIVPSQQPALMAEKIIELVENKSLLKNISLAGYNSVKALSWEKQSRRLEQIISSNLNK